MYSTSKLIIRSLQEKDTALIVKWRNDLEITKFLFSSRGLTREEHLAWLAQLADDNTRREFLLVEKENGFPIGTIGLSNVDFLHRKGELGIMIGEKEFQGRGYGKEACQFIVKYGFGKLGLNKIYLRAFTDNESAITLYEKIGFQKEGILREEIFKDGLFKDVMAMAILKKNYIQPTEF
ncbi:MAG: UDP-4-amino-4,6-dideoxy-N-acetyl-beta-L-altrosamine N-acetyltransferase [Carboxydocellales bacterium]